MRDPQPHRITGDKQVVVEYQVNVGHLMAAVAALVVVFVAYRFVTRSDGSDSSDDVDESEAAAIDVGPVSSSGGLGGNSEGTSGWMEEQLSR